MQTFTLQRSSKALSVHVDGCNTSVSSAVLRGVRPKPKHRASMERVAGRPKDKEAAKLTASRPAALDPLQTSATGSFTVSRLMR
jgi:hypothetical protein